MAGSEAADTSGTASGGKVWNPPSSDEVKRSTAHNQLNSSNVASARLFARIQLQQALQESRKREIRAAKFSRNVKLVVGFLLVGFGVTSTLYALNKGIPGFNSSVFSKGDETHFYMANVTAANALFFSFGLMSVALGLVSFIVIFNNWGYTGIIGALITLLIFLPMTMSRLPDQSATLADWANTSLNNNNAIPFSYSLASNNANYLVHDIENKPYQLLITRTSNGVKAVLNPIR